MAQQPKLTACMNLAGNTAFLNYVLQMPYGNGNIDVWVDDRIYLLTPDLLLNESTLRKFGIRVGELLLVIDGAEVLPTL